MLYSCLKKIADEISSDGHLLRVTTLVVCPGGLIFFDAIFSGYADPPSKQQNIERMVDVMSNFISTQPYDRQSASAYAAYMIGSGLFHSCRCLNHGEASRLHMHYAEMQDKKQEELEKLLIRRTQKLGKRFLWNLREMAAEVEFWMRDGVYRVEFSTGGFETIAFEITAKGKIKLFRFAG